MSHRRTPYKPPRNRREVAIAVSCAIAIVVVTAVLVWVFRPNKDLGTNNTIFPEPTAPVTAPASDTTAPAATTTTP
jgi:hypothetical protein